jgi:hypothetical protein
VASGGARAPPALAALVGALGLAGDNLRRVTVPLAPAETSGARGGMGASAVGWARGGQQQGVSGAGGIETSKWVSALIVSLS